MKLKKSALCLLLAGALAATVLSGCAKQQMTKVVLAVDVAPATLLGGIYAALDKGIYKAAGIELEIIETDPGKAAALVREGKAQFATSTQEDLAYLLDKEPSPGLTAVSALTAQNPIGLMTNEKKRVYTLKEMEGKKLAFTGSPSQIAMMKEVMRHEGLDDSRISFEKIPAADAETALQKGTQGVIVNRMQFMNYTPKSNTKNKQAEPFFDFGTINPDLSFYGYLLVGSEAFLQQHENVARAFVHSTSAGYNYGSEQPEALAKLVKKHHPDLDPKQISKSQEQVCKLYRSTRSNGGKERWGHIDKKRWNAYFRFLYQQKLITKELKDTGYTTDFLN